VLLLWVVETGSITSPVLFCFHCLSTQDIEQVIRDFCGYMKSKNKNEKDMNGLVDYLDYLHNSEDQQGKGYAATTIQNVLSIIAAYYLHLHGILLSKTKPIVYAKLRGWRKTHTVKRSRELSVEETDRFLSDAPNSHEYLPIKVASVLSYYGLLRRGELMQITFENIRFHDGETCEVLITREKQTDTREHQSFFITGHKCLEALREYYACFKDNDSTINN